MMTLAAVGAAVFPDQRSFQSPSTTRALNSALAPLLVADDARNNDLPNCNWSPI